MRIGRLGLHRPGAPFPATLFLLGRKVPKEKGLRSAQACLCVSVGSGYIGLGPPSLRLFFFWDARSPKKKVSGRPRPVYAYGNGFRVTRRGGLTRGRSSVRSLGWQAFAAACIHLMCARPNRSNSRNRRRVGWGRQPRHRQRPGSIDAGLQGLQVHGPPGMKRPVKVPE